MFIKSCDDKCFILIYNDAGWIKKIDDVTFCFSTKYIIMMAFFLLYYSHVERDAVFNEVIAWYTMEITENELFNLLRRLQEFSTFRRDLICPTSDF